MKLHNNQKPFCCTVCKEAFPTKKHLERHEGSHPVAEVEKVRPFSCLQCGNSFKRKAHLKYHENTHKNSPQKSQPCSEGDEDPLNLNVEDNSSKKVEDVSCDFVKSEDTSDISNGNVKEEELILDDIDIKHEFF